MKQNKPVSTQVETITPDKAREYLEHNVGNRVVRTSWVDGLANMMSSNMWELTHQGIAFDHNGRLIDGQHRLLAVIRSGSTVQMMVSRGLNPDVFRHVDGGASRRNFDRIKLVDGPRVNIICCAVVREFLVHSGGSKGRHSSSDINVNVLEDTFLAHSDAFEMVSTKLNETRIRGISRAAIGAAVACYAAVFPKEAEDFMDRLLTGSNIEARSGLLLLRQGLLSSRISDDDEYWKTIQATQLHHKNAEAGSLVSATSDWLGGRYSREVFRRTSRGNRAARSRRNKDGAA